MWLYFLPAAEFLETAKPPSCLYMYAIELNCIASSYYRSARDHNCQRLNSKYCDKTVNAQAGSHVCIWRESARALTHVLKHTVSIGYHKEKTRNTSAYSLSASTIYHHRILQFRNDLTRLWDNSTRLWVCAHATWRHLF